MDFTNVKKLSSFINEEIENINIHFPKAIITVMDERIRAMGISRESFIKMAVVERLGIMSAT